MCMMVLNNELNGVELYFDEKPMQNIIDNLKSSRFRWHRSKKCWYAKQNEETLKIANKLSKNDADLSNTINPATKTNNETVHASLWERTQFINGMTDADQYDYKYVGSNYTPGLSTKEIAAEVRKHLRRRFPEVKFSIRCREYNSIDCDIISSPYDYKKLEYNPELEPYQYREYEAEHNKELLAIIEYATKFIQSYNYDDSDSMTDYFDTNFYGGRCEVSYNYTQTEQTEAIKSEISNFRLQFAEAEKQAQIQKEKEFQEHQKQRALDIIASEEYEKQEAINAEIVNNNVSYTDLAGDAQYMINNVKIAHLNKNNTYKEYEEEITKGDESFSVQSMKVTRELNFKTLEALELFKNMLLHDFEFISGTGGAYTDNNTFTSITDYHHMTKAEKENIVWNLYGIAVYYDNELQFTIDAQGHNYARYVGITDEAEISNIPPVTELSEEFQNYKNTADRIEDLSTEIIANNKIDDFRNSTEYKTLFLDTLKKNGIEISKNIIRLVNIEDLKIYLYGLLAYVESVKTQFKNANIQSGEKITIIAIDDMIGMVSTSRVTFDRYEDCKYAQYDDAVKVIFTPERKIKQHYSYYHSNRNFLIVSGWVTIPEDILWETGISETGLAFRKSKYPSCDTQQLIDIKNHFISNGNKFLIDRIRTN